MCVLIGFSLFSWKFFHGVRCPEGLTDSKNIYSWRQTFVFNKSGRSQCCLHWLVSFHQSLVMSGFTQQIKQYYSAGGFPTNIPRWIMQYDNVMSFIAKTCTRPGKRQKAAVALNICLDRPGIWATWFELWWEEWLQLLLRMVGFISWAEMIWWV